MLRTRIATFIMGKQTYLATRIVALTLERGDRPTNDSPFPENCPLAMSLTDITYLRCFHKA